MTHVDGRLRVGASVPVGRLAEHPVVRDRFLALRSAAGCVGSLQIQSRATLAGNACNASPAADTAPSLLAYEATFGVRSARGRREVTAKEFWVAPGRTVLEPDEWVEYVELSDAGDHGSAYVKLGRTRGVDLALVGVACVVRDGGVRVACASLSATPRRLPTLESALESTVDGTSLSDADLERAIAADVTPISDVRASARYRLAMAAVCARRAHRSAAESMA
jgi:carbon-monoxide dehydrogenase medium subunit